MHIRSIIIGQLTAYNGGSITQARRPGSSGERIVSQKQA
jgi:hypothetical protein